MQSFSGTLELEIRTKDKARGKDAEPTNPRARLFAGLP